MFRSLSRVLARFDKRPVNAKRCANTRSFVVKGEKPIYALLLCPAAAFGLGVWQIQRRSWKLDLIENLRVKTESAPVELPQDLRELDDMEYRAVYVRGVFDHDEEIYVGPRSDKDSGRIGFYVITPLKVEDRDYSILVNRGWVPRDKTNPATRREGQVSGVVEIEGIVRGDEPKPIGSRGDVGAGDFFAMRDITRLAQKVGAAPVFIDATDRVSVPGGPKGGQTRVELRNEHMSYIVTWFGLSAATFYLWFMKYRKLIRR